VLKASYLQGLRLLLDTQSGPRDPASEAKVDEAIQYLEKARKLAEAPGHESYQAECDFYLGKAYLKKKDLSRARGHFEALIRLKSTQLEVSLKQAEAASILDAMARLEMRSSVNPRGRR